MLVYCEQPTRGGPNFARSYPKRVLVSLDNIE